MDACVDPNGDVSRTLPRVCSKYPYESSSHYVFFGNSVKRTSYFGGKATSLLATASDCGYTYSLYRLTLSILLCWYYQTFIIHVRKQALRKTDWKLYEGKKAGRGCFKPSWSWCRTHLFPRYENERFRLGQHSYFLPGAVFHTSVALLCASVNMQFFCIFRFSLFTADILCLGGWFTLSQVNISTGGSALCALILFSSSFATPPRTSCLRLIDRSFPRQTLTEFSKKHRGHVARSWAEAQELVNDLEVVQGEYYRAKDAYEQACINASRCAQNAHLVPGRYCNPS